MPRHAFKFPSEAVEAVKAHVRIAVAAVSPVRYRQEAPYTAALVSRLEGIAYDGEFGRVEFIGTMIDDRGSGSAESIYGADFAITAKISDGRTTIEKAILVQVKLGTVANLSPSETKDLEDQIRNMRKLVNAPKVMEIPESNGSRTPRILSGNRVLAGKEYSTTPLVDYFTSRVMTTLDGCTRPDRVSIVQDSRLLRVHVDAKTFPNSQRRS